MADNALGSDVIVQVGIIVRDVEKTARAWAELLGVAVPPWRMTGPADETNICYRGQTTTGRAKLAFFSLGQVSLELIEPVGGPSTWQEFLDRHGQGMHHIAFRIQGMDGVLARLAARNVPLVQRGDYKGGALCVH